MAPRTDEPDAPGPPDRPPITINDPGRPATTYDVVGDDRERWRPSGRLLARLAGGSVLVALGTTTAVGARSVHSEHARERKAAAAFRVSDRVHLTAVPGSVVVTPDPVHRFALVALAALVDIREQGPSTDQVTGIDLVGAGLAPGRYTKPVLRGVPGVTQGVASSLLDCPRVARGSVPQVATVRVSVLTAAHRTHVQTLAVRPEALRQAALESCDLPDPLARPQVSGDVQRGRVQVWVRTVPRSRAALVLQGVTGPGLQVTIPFVALPYRLHRDSGFGFGVLVKVVDCAVARQQVPTLTAVVRDGTTLRRLDVTPTAPSLPGPEHVAGVSPLAPHLAALIAATCS